MGRWSQSRPPGPASREARPRSWARPGRAGPRPGGPADRPGLLVRRREPLTAAAPRRPVGSNRMLRPPHPGRVRNPVWYALVTRAEHAEHEAAGDVRNLPAWRRSTRGELRWPVSISIIAAIVLQLLLPDQLSMRPLPMLLLPVLEGGLLLGLAIANPVRIERRGVFVRWVSIVLILVITAANAASAVLLIREILTDQPGDQPRWAAAGLRRGHLGHQRDRVRPLVLGVRPGRPGASRPRHVPVPGLPVPADDRG